MKRHIPIVVILLYAAALYSPYLLRTIRYDEAYTLHHFAISPLIALFDWSAPNNHKLYSLLVWFTQLFVNNHLLALRLPAFCAALIGVVLVYRMGGALPAALLATNPVFADYAVNGRGYTLMIALALTFLLAKRDRAMFWLSVGLVLTLPSNIIILAARPKRVAILGAITGVLFYLPALAWGEVGSSLRFGSSLAEMEQEFGTIFNGTGIFILCGVLLLGAWWALRYSLSFSRWRLPAKFFTGGIISIFSRSYVSWSVAGLLIVAVPSLPSTLNQLTELDRVQPILQAQMQSSDGLIAGCCADEPLREVYSDAYARVNPARWFVVPSTYGIVDLTGCEAVSAEVYRCARKAIAERP